MPLYSRTTNKEHLVKVVILIFLLILKSSQNSLDMWLFSANPLALDIKTQDFYLPEQGHRMQAVLSYTAYFTFWAFSLLYKRLYF